MNEYCFMSFSPLLRGIDGDDYRRMTTTLIRLSLGVIEQVITRMFFLTDTDTQ